MEDIKKKKTTKPCSQKGKSIMSEINKRCDKKKKRLDKEKEN